MVDKMVALSAA
jgi:hypothetical protein